MEEAMEEGNVQNLLKKTSEARQKNSQDPSKTLEILEEWKKLWDNVIIQSYKKYFLSFSTKYWKNGRSQAKKFTRPFKNFGNVERMEEVVEKENNIKLQKIFSIIFHKLLEEWKKLDKKIHKTH